MKLRIALTNQLRDHIVGGLHTGQLSAGDRLPSIREVAEEMGSNERTVAAAYRALEAEHLVEIRGRSGVFVAAQQLLAGERPVEIVTWLSGVLLDAWKRRIPVTRLPEMIRGVTRSRRVRCGLVDVVEDGIVAFRHELQEEFGLDVRALAPDALHTDVDFFATTSFYASAVHEFAERNGKPMVLIRVNPLTRTAIERQLQRGVLTIVCVDPRFTDRIRVGYEVADPAQLRTILVTDTEQLRRLNPNEPVLLTRAARQHLGAVNAHLILPHSPTLSAETAQDVATLLVKMNLETA